MVVITPTNTSVETLEGLHLYHGAISNCSMRVRMTLIEKGLDWESHHLDLKKKVAVLGPPLQIKIFAKGKPLEVRLHYGFPVL